MKIHSLRSESRGDRARVSATVVWEDVDRPTEELFFETEARYADDLTCNPHAFLVGRIVPAMYYGEKRIAIDADICPELLSGLSVAMSVLQLWHYHSRGDLVRIEAGTQVRSVTPRGSRAGFFFSGGIDAFATLRKNQLRFPVQHSGYIKDGLLVYGLELDLPEAYELVTRSLSEVARQVNITLIPVYTNIYLAYRKEDEKNGFDLWINQFQGSAFAAIAHAFAERFNTVSIASSDHIANLMREGTHPLLDPNYGSSGLRILHDGVELTRFAKTELVAGWQSALRHLRVCNQYNRYRPDRLNCGECEKCVRTMLALLALGALDRSPAFPRNDVDAELVLRLARPSDGMVAASYEELIAPLENIGRDDLVRAIKKILARYDRKGIRPTIARIDQRYLRGRLRDLKRAIVR